MAEQKIDPVTGRPILDKPPLPAVGRVVHYVAYGTPGGEFPAGVCRAAVITETIRERDKDFTEADWGAFPTGGTGRIAICVLNPSGLFFNQGIPYDPNKAPGTWHWPERV